MEIDVGADYLNKLGTAKALEHIARADGEAQNANERAVLESRRAADAKEDALQAKQEVFNAQHELAVAGNELREAKLQLARAQKELEGYKSLPQPMLDMIHFFLNDESLKEKRRESMKAWIRSSSIFQEMTNELGQASGLSEEEIMVKAKEKRSKFEEKANVVANNLIPPSIAPR